MPQQQQGDFNPADHGAVAVSDFDPTQAGGAPVAPAGPKSFDERLRDSMQKGAENFAQGTANAVTSLKDVPSKWMNAFAHPIDEAKKEAVDQVTGIAQGIKGAVDYGKSVIQDPANLGQAVTQFGVPALATAVGGAGLATDLAKRAEFTEGAKAVTQQANADQTKAQLLAAVKQAKNSNNMKMAQVVGQLDQSASIPKVELYSQLTKYFGDKLESAPLDVSRLIGDAQKGAAGDMSFGQVDNLRQTIYQQMKSGNSSALRGAYKQISQTLSQLADKQGMGAEYGAAKSAIEDFHANVVPKGGIIDRATSSTSEDYHDIMQPLSSPATRDKLLRLKAAGADINPDSITQRVQAYKTYDKYGNAVGSHALRPQNLTETLGGLGGALAGGQMGHPIIGAELGVQGARSLASHPAYLPPIE